MYMYIPCIPPTITLKSPRSDGNNGLADDDDRALGDGSSDSSWSADDGTLGGGWGYTLRTLFGGLPNDHILKSYSACNNNATFVSSTYSISLGLLCFIL